jgi:hypothetical protein
LVTGAVITQVHQALHTLMYQEAMTLHQVLHQDTVSPTTIMGTVKLAIDVLKMTILKAIIDAMQDRQDVTTWMTWAPLKHVTVEMRRLQAMMSMMKSLGKHTGNVTIDMKSMRRTQTEHMSMTSLAKKTTTMKRTEGIQMIIVNTLLSTTTEQEKKSIMPMRKIQVVMMKHTHMRGAIAMRNHTIVIANQSMHMILTIQEGVTLNTEHNQTLMLESQVKQAFAHAATVKKKRNSASSNS